MGNINFLKHQKIKLVTNEEKQSLEIGKSAVDAGLLKKFPDSSLAVFLYLLTHLKKDNYLEININNISSSLACDSSEIKKSLDYMNDNDIIDIEKKTNLEFEIIINAEKLNETKEEKNILINRKSFNNFKDKKIYRKKIINKEYPSLNELKKAIVSFLADDIDYRQFNEEIDQWLSDFSKEIIQELIRRVNKWLEKQRGQENHNNAFYYLRGIIDDWYNKEIFDLDKLKYFDRLYRETKDLAKVYGIKWRNINPTQLETFKSWLIDDFALSSSLVQYAIKEGVKRKRDGQPSLKYIEDNFIKPLKNNKIRSVREARKYFAKKKNYNRNQNSNQKKEEKDDNINKWDKFYWDL
ncbi:MAG: DnaD domain protein [Bacillota bacterium]